MIRVLIFSEKRIKKTFEMKMRGFRVFLQQEKSLSYLRRKSIREIFSFLLIMAGPVLKLVEEAYLFRILYSRYYVRYFL